MIERQDIDRKVDCGYKKVNNFQLPILFIEFYRPLTVRAMRYTIPQAETMMNIPMSP